MKIISKKFFEMAQRSAREAEEMTTYHGGAFDWGIAMFFLRAAYGLATVEEIEIYNRNIEALQDDKG